MLKNKKMLDEKIERYFDDLFAGVGQSQRLFDLKEELSTNLKEKIADYQSRGLSDEQAFKEAVISMGDLSGLVEDRHVAGAGYSETIGLFLDGKPDFHRRHHCWGFADPVRRVHDLHAVFHGSLFRECSWPRHLHCRRRGVIDLQFIDQRNAQKIWNEQNSCRPLCSFDRGDPVCFFLRDHHLFC